MGLYSNWIMVLLSKDNYRYRNENEFSLQEFYRIVGKTKRTITCYIIKNVVSERRLVSILENK